MKNIYTVMKFTAYDLIHKKSFWFTNVFFVILIILAANINNIYNYFNNEEKTEKVLIIDKDNIYNDNLYILNNLGLEEQIVIEKKGYTKEEYEEILEKEKYEYALEITKNDNNIIFSYYTNDKYFVGAEVLETIVSKMYTDLKIKELGLTDDEIIKINPNFSNEYTNFSTEQNLNEANYLVGIFLTIILFYAIYFYSAQVSSSVTTEKTSKIVEVLLTSTNSNSIIIGKTLGLGLVGLLQILGLTLIGILCVNLFLSSDIISVILKEINITPIFLIIILLYFLLGYLLYSFMFALTGATVSRTEDIQSANTPVSIITVISFYAAFFSLQNPESPLNILSKYVSFSSPFSMPISYITGNSNLTEVFISLLILLITVIIVAYISIRIYKNAILNSGSKLNIKSLVKTFKEKN